MQCRNNIWDINNIMSFYDITYYMEFDIYKQSLLEKIKFKPFDCITNYDHVYWVTGRHLQFTLIAIKSMQSRIHVILLRDIRILVSYDIKVTELLSVKS